MSFVHITERKWVRASMITAVYIVDGSSAGTYAVKIKAPGVFISDLTSSRGHETLTSALQAAGTLVGEIERMEEDEDGDL